MPWSFDPGGYSAVAFVEHPMVQRTDVLAELILTEPHVCQLTGHEPFESEWGGRLRERSGWCGTELTGERIGLRLIDDRKAEAIVIRLESITISESFEEVAAWIVGIGSPPFRLPGGASGPNAGVREPRRPQPGGPSIAATLDEEFEAIVAGF